MLIPRSRLFGRSDRSAPQLSPDGRWIAYLAVSDNVNTVWLAPADDPSSARPLTGADAGVGQFDWARTSRHLIVGRDHAGDENWWLQAVDIDSGAALTLSPRGGSESRLAAMSDDEPFAVLIESNERDPAFFDLYRVDIRSGDRRLVLRNDRFTWIYADYRLRPRLAEARREDGGIEYHRLCDDGRWEHLYTVSQEDEAITRPFRRWELPNTFASQDRAYALDSRGRNTGALVTWDLATGAVEELASDPRADIGGAIVHPATRELLGYVAHFDRPLIRPLHESLARDLALVETDRTLSIAVTSQAQDGRRSIVSRSAPHRVTEHVLIDGAKGRVRVLFREREELADQDLARMYPRTVRTRDGLDLLCYLTLPVAADPAGGGHPPAPLPMVVLVHGGPWIRDEYAFDPWIQLLANRGYAVLNVNFRGSRGFGKSLLNAGDHEWGGKMYDDVVDAVEWAVAEGIADRQRLAIMGASFGGYTTLVGMTRTPELYACGIDLFGVSNLETFLASIPAHWKAYASMWEQRLGNTATEAGRRRLRERSPIHHVERIVRPVLIGQGSNDPRVVQRESDQMVQALTAQGTPVVYALYPDEGHSFAKRPNQLSFFSIVEHFLAHYLGGSCEPVGDAFDRSSVTLPAGAHLLPGIAEALLRRDRSEDGTRMGRTEA